MSWHSRPKTTILRKACLPSWHLGPWTSGGFPQVPQWQGQLTVPKLTVQTVQLSFWYTQQGVPVWLAPRNDLELLRAEALHTHCRLFLAGGRGCCVGTRGRAPKEACTGLLPGLVHVSSHGALPTASPHHSSALRLGLTTSRRSVLRVPDLGRAQWAPGTNPREIRSRMFALPLKTLQGTGSTYTLIMIFNLHCKALG